jgi:hypothetical protein
MFSGYDADTRGENRTCSYYGYTGQVTGPGREAVPAVLHVKQARRRRGSPPGGKRLDGPGVAHSDLCGCVVSCAQAREQASVRNTTGRASQARQTRGSCRDNAPAGVGICARRWGRATSSGRGETTATDDNRGLERDPRGEKYALIGWRESSHDSGS